MTPYPRNTNRNYHRGSAQVNSPYYYIIIIIIVISIISIIIIKVFPRKGRPQNVAAGDSDARGLRLRGSAARGLNARQMCNNNNNNNNNNDNDNDNNNNNNIYARGRPADLRGAKGVPRKGD